MEQVWNNNVRTKQINKQLDWVIGQLRMLIVQTNAMLVVFAC